MTRTPLLLLLSVLSISSIANAGFKFGGLTINQVNTQLESLLLPQINSLRSSAHPTPDVPLTPLEWDANLAKSAGQWASKCIVDDNSDDFYSGKVGESITTLTIRDFVKNLVRAADGVNLWASQNATYDYTSDNCFTGDQPHSCADYRQLLWDNSRKIGCATNICKKQASLVCQYFPPGDAPGVRPFKSSQQDLTALYLDIESGNITREEIDETQAPAPPTSKRAIVRGTNDYGDGCKPNPSLPTGECTTYDTCLNTGGRRGIWGAAVCGGGDNILCCIRDKDYVPNGATSAPTAAPTPATPAPTPATAAPTPATAAPNTPTSAPATTRPTSAPATTRPTSAPATTRPTSAPATAAPSPSGSPLRLPAGSYNWRGTQAVTSVKDQSSCGSCWAFSTSAAAESAWAIKTGGAQIDIAEQRLVDCETTRSKGCNGGSAAGAMPYLISNRAVSESAYPYTKTQGTCKTVTGDLGKWANYTRMTSKDNSDDNIKAALARYGPMVVYIYADDVWQNYKSGVVSSNQYTSINHAVLLVGYDAGLNAWVIKNSWGTWWGDKGFIYMDVNGNFGMKVEGPYYIQAL